MNGDPSNGKVGGVDDLDLDELADDFFGFVIDDMEKDKIEE